MEACAGEGHCRAHSVSRHAVAAPCPTATWWPASRTGSTRRAGDRHREPHPVTAVRNLGPERAEASPPQGCPRRPAPLRHRFGLAGDRGGLPARAVRRAFRDRARRGARASPRGGVGGAGERPRGARPARARDAARPRRARRRGSRARRRARRPRHRAGGVPESNVVPRPATRATRSTPSRCSRRAALRLTLAARTTPTIGHSVGGEYAVAAREWGLDEPRWSG